MKKILLGLFAIAGSSAFMMGTTININDETGQGRITLYDGQSSASSTTLGSMVPDPDSDISMFRLNGKITFTSGDQSTSFYPDLTSPIASVLSGLQDAGMPSSLPLTFKLVFNSGNTVSTTISSDTDSSNRQFKAMFGAYGMSDLVDHEVS